MDKTGTRAYLHWAAKRSLQHWGGRAEVYIAFATYCLIIIGSILAWILGDWFDGLFQAATIILAVIGLLAILYDFGVRLPHQMWAELHAQADAQLAEILEYMRIGRDLRNRFGRQRDHWDAALGEEADSWEMRVYKWLRNVRPDYAESFMIEMPETPQAWAPNVREHRNADWLNRMDRRLKALDTLVAQIRNEQRVLQ